MKDILMLNITLQRINMNLANLKDLEDKAVDMLDKLYRKLPSHVIDEFLAYDKMSERVNKARGYVEGYTDGYFVGFDKGESK